MTDLSRRMARLEGVLPAKPIRYILVDRDGMTSEPRREVGDSAQGFDAVEVLDPFQRRPVPP